MIPEYPQVVSRGLEEHPESDLLHVFRVCLLRFVCQNASEASAEEKKLKNSNHSLAMDHEYVLYAVERKVSTRLTNSNISNINLMLSIYFNRMTASILSTGHPGPGGPKHGEGKLQRHQFSKSHQCSAFLGHAGLSVFCFMTACLLSDGV